jgi:hypothetical protein
VPAHDDALHAVRPAERARRLLDLARLQPRPDVGGRDRVAVGDERHALGGEVVLLTELAQQRDVALGLVPEPEVLADDDVRRVQPVDQDLADELVRRRLRQLEGEREDGDRVGAEALQQLDPVPGRGEQRRMGARPDDLVGMRVEGDDHRAQAAAAGLRHRGADDPLMAAVHAVEHPDGDH